MAIAFTCPSCGKSLQLPDHAAGKTGKCKACGARVAIPADVAVEADSYAVIEPEPPRPADPPPAPDSIAAVPDSRGISSREACQACFLPGRPLGNGLGDWHRRAGVRRGSGNLAAARFLAARRKASEAVERQAARDAATRPEPAPQPVAAPAVTATPLDEAGLPPREADPAIAELETFARDLALTAIRLRRVIEPVKTLQEAVRVAPEVARLGKVLGSAEERQKAIPTSRASKQRGSIRSTKKSSPGRWPPRRRSWSGTRLWRRRRL